MTKTYRLRCFLAVLLCGCLLCAAFPASAYGITTLEEKEAEATRPADGSEGFTDEELLTLRFGSKAAIYGTRLYDLVIRPYTHCVIAFWIFYAVFAVYGKLGKTGERT